MACLYVTTTFEIRYCENSNDRKVKFVVNKNHLHTNLEEKHYKYCLSRQCYVLHIVIWLEKITYLVCKNDSLLKVGKHLPMVTSEVSVWHVCKLLTVLAS